MSLGASHNGEAGSMRRLYRDPRNGVVFGVCAGVADYFGFDLAVTRVLTIIGAFVFPFVIVAYLLLGLLLPSRTYSDREYDDRADPVQRRARIEPHSMLSNVRYRFRDVDARLQRLEKYVTSNRYKLDREFRQLKD